MNSDCSLVISTYNWPEALRLCLLSVSAQSVLPSEVIIADDGSNEKTRELIESMRSTLAIPLIHVWQEDNGYQLARIRNKAFMRASFSYIIQIDGDIILDSRFIEDHLKFRKKGNFISGTRSMISSGLTSELCRSGNYELGVIRQSALGKKANSKRFLPLGFLVSLVQRGGRNIHYVLGCNMAFWKEDLFKVNGYDESFLGWGKEDNDIAARLINAGIKLRFMKFAGIEYHLYHKEAAGPGLRRNEERFRENWRRHVVFAVNGMLQHKEKNNYAGE